MIGPFLYADELIHSALGDDKLDRQHAALRVLATIAHHGAASGSCFLTDKTIADHNRISEKTVQRAVKLLVSLGYVQVDRGDRRGCKATTYRLPINRNRSGAARLASDTMQPSNGRETGHSHVRNSSLETGHSHVRNTGGETGHLAPRNRTSGAPKPDIVMSPKPDIAMSTQPVLTEVEPRSNQEGGFLDSRSRSEDSEEETDTGGPHPIPLGATIPDLIDHAWIHGNGREVVRRICERLGIDPEKKGGAIGQHVWPLTKPGSEPPSEQLLRAARWVEKAIDPRMVADKPPLDGFLLIASGSEGSSDVPWPIARGSEAHCSHLRRGAPYRPPGEPSGAAHVVAEDILQGIPARETSTQSEQLRQLDQVRGQARPFEWKSKLARPRVSLSLDDLQAHADDPILAAELARRQRKPAEATPITAAVEVMAAIV